MEGIRHTRDVGRARLGSLRSALSRRLAATRAQPERLPLTAGAGPVRRDPPGPDARGAALGTSPAAVWRRYVEREIEQHASLLLELSLSALQVLGAAPGNDGHDHEDATELAVVFTDLAGFTAFTARHGDAAALEHLERVAGIVDPIVAERGGKVVMRLGDGQLLTFADPDAALLGTLELVEASPPPLRMRAGAHWGTPVLTADDVIGHDVNLAARVTDGARAGEVLVTEALREASSEVPGLRFGRVARRRMKGIDGRVRVCRVEREAVVPVDGPVPR